MTQRCAKTKPIFGPSLHCSGPLAGANCTLRCGETISRSRLPLDSLLHCLQHQRPDLALSTSPSFLLPIPSTLLSCAHHRPLLFFLAPRHLMRFDLSSPTHSPSPLAIDRRYRIARLQARPHSSSSNHVTQELKIQRVMVSFSFSGGAMTLRRSH